MLAVMVATFPWMKSTRPINRPLNDVLDGIQSGKWKRGIEEIRSLLRQEKKEDAKRKKEKLPSFYASGEADSPKTMKSHSGLIQMDFDGLGDEFPRLREKLPNDPHAAVVFTSPSGTGIKVLCWVGPVDGEEEHERAFSAACAHYSNAYGVEPDLSCKNWNRHCLISSDADISRKSCSHALDWKSTAPERERREKKEDSSSRLEDSNTSILPDCRTTPQEDVESVASDEEPVLRAIGFQLEIERKHKPLWDLYNTLVERRHEARGGRRNETIIQAVPFLHRALATSLVRRFLEWFYRMNAHVFSSSLEEHMKEVEGFIRDVESAYVANLSLREQSFYNAFGEREKDAFRIARDLAFLTGSSSLPPPEFFLSGGTLAERLGLFRSNGHPQDEAGARILRTFVQYAVVKVTVPGKRREKDNSGKPSCYRWLLGSHLSGEGRPS